MRDVSPKVTSYRTAIAQATVVMAPETIAMIREGRAPKGDPIPVARVAAIQAAKNTPSIIPYCHSVPLDQVTVDFHMADDRIEVTVGAKAIYRTGVEMEALTGAAAAALNLYDLLKPVDETMEIVGVKLLDKTGGKSNFGWLDDAFRAAVLVASDSRTLDSDESGAILKRGAEAHGGAVEAFIIVPDDAGAIAEQLISLCDLGLDLILITGGTGIGPRDVTPEAVLPLLDRNLDGVTELYRSYSLSRRPISLLSRSFAGMRGATVVVGLPGSPGACQDAIDCLFPYLKHAFRMVRGGGHDG